MRILTPIRIENQTGRAIPRAHVALRLTQLLTRLPLRPLCVRVQFSDDNGPRGGPDIRCRMLAGVPGKSTVRVAALAPTARAAFDRAYERVCRQMERPWRRWREEQRHPKKYFAARRLWT